MGRKRLPIEVLEKRGSWKAAAYKKAEAARKKPRVRKKAARGDVRILTADEILTGIPNYDPAVGAEDYCFDYAKAVKAIEFFHNKLRHVKGEKTGQPFILEAWEQAIIGNVFGWIHKETGYRRYKEIFIEIARKNGKTPLAAGMILYLLFEDGEPGAEIYGAASEYKQASLVFAHAWGMVNQCSELKDMAHVFKGQSKAIEKGQPGDIDYGIYRVICSDADTSQGFNTHAVVVDELHTQPNRDLVDALTTSTGARRQPLLIYITTSDYEREGSICNEKEDYAIKVCEGSIKDVSFLPVVYQAALEDDWTDIETWRKANPNLGVSVSLEYLERECKRAQEMPVFENIFKRLHLNIRTEQQFRWLNMEQWSACGHNVNIQDLIGKPCLGGLDLSNTKDVTCLVLGFGLEDEKFVILPYFWIPKEHAVIREKRDKVPYLTWEKQGYIEFTPGNSVDYGFIRKRINEISDSFNIQMIGYDPYNATQIANELKNEDGFEMIEFRQGLLSMNEPSKEFERKISNKTLIHPNNPVLNWMASNVGVFTDKSGNIRPVKPENKSPLKIDGIVSAIMAVGLAITVPAKQESVYETRGVLVL